MSSYLLWQSWAGGTQILPQLTPPSGSIKLLSFLNSCPSWSSLYARTEQFWGPAFRNLVLESSAQLQGWLTIWGLSSTLPLPHLAFFIPLTGLDDLKKYLVLRFCLCPYKPQPDKCTLVVAAAGPLSTASSILTSINSVLAQHSHIFLLKKKKKRVPLNSCSLGPTVKSNSFEASEFLFVHLALYFHSRYLYTHYLRETALQGH